jgi:acetyl esterase/lipase
MRRLLVAAGLVAFAAGAQAQMDAEPIPIEHFARVPDIASVSMSPDGLSIAAIIAAPGSGNQDTALATWDLSDQGSGPVITPSGDRMKFIAASAMQAGRVLVAGRQEWTGPLMGCGEGASTGSTATFLTKTYLTDASHAEFEEAFARRGRRAGVDERLQRCFELAGTASLVSQLPLDPDHVVIQQLNQQSLRADYYRYNLNTGETELLFRGSRRENASFLDPRDGQVLVRDSIEQAGSDYEIRYQIRNAQGEFEPHPELTQRLSERITQAIVGRDEESGQFYVITDRFADNAAVYFYDPAERRLSDEPILAHPDYEAAGVILGSYASNFNQPLGFSYLAGDREVFWLDPQIAALQESLEGAFPGSGVRIMDFNEDFSTVLFVTGSGAEPPSYYVLRNQSEAVLLGRSRPWMEGARMREPELTSYTARDGMEIPAIVTLPSGWSESDGPLPAIVLPHGGPWARDTTGWDGSGWPQFLASRGYAVLQPQYRGSTGFGRSLWLAGDAEWGQAMQDDKDDGAAWLVSQGIADPARIAIFGYSYGGFAAAAAVVRPDSPYKCAISGAPVTDLARLGNTWSENRLQRILQGETVRGMDPMRNADRANIPVLLYVGDRDVRTPAFHARNFYNAVRGRVPARLEIIRDMPHSLPWYHRHHVQTLELIEDYLANDCGGGGL